MEWNGSEDISLTNYGSISIKFAFFFQVCSNYINPVKIFLNAIFRLTDFLSGPFDFSPSETR